VWEAATGAAVHVLRGHPPLAWSLDGSMLATHSGDRSAKVWGAATCTLQNTLNGHASGVLSVARSRDRSVLSTDSYDNTVRLWDVATGTATRVIKKSGLYGWYGFQGTWYAYVGDVSGVDPLWEAGVRSNSIWEIFIYRVREDQCIEQQFCPNRST
jgi:WD40 repeat protein